MRNCVVTEFVKSRIHCSWLRFLPFSFSSFPCSLSLHPSLIQGAWSQPLTFPKKITWIYFRMRNRWWRRWNPVGDRNFVFAFGGRFIVCFCQWSYPAKQSKNPILIVVADFRITTRSCSFYSHLVLYPLQVSLRFDVSRLPSSHYALIFSHNELLVANVSDILVLIWPTSL